MNTDQLFSIQENRTGLPQLGSVFYETMGKGDITLVLLHGFPFDRRLWYSILPYLQGIRVLIPDMPGVGNSQLKNGAQPEMTGYAKGIMAMLEQENISQCIMAGHSMGGYIALAFAELFPEKLIGLSMVHSSAYADDAERKKKRLQTINFIREHGALRFTSSFIPAPFAPAYNNEPEINKLIKWSGDCTSDGLMTAVNAMMERPDRTSVLNKSTVPVQWIIGDQDPVFAPSLSFAQAALSNISSVNVLHNTGHMGMIESSEETAKALLQFCFFCQHMASVKV